jgi:hypothetical protein
MRCTACGHKYRADINQPIPGGSSSPGVFFILNLLFLAAAGLFIILSEFILLIILAAFMVITLIVNLMAWMDCRGWPGQKAKGLKCPECGRGNKVHPWSL